MVLAFKVAIVTFSCVFSLIKIGDYFLVGGQDAYFTNKTMVGSQRLDLYFYWFLDSGMFQTKNRFIKILKIIFALIILLGLLNTFSRSSIIALFGTSVIFFCMKINYRSGFFRFSNFKTFLKYLFIGIIFILLVWKIFHVHFEFYLIRILIFFRVSLS